MTLRKSLTGWVAALTVVALVAAASVIVSSVALRRTAAIMGAAIESVRLAEESELDLLLYDRTADSLQRTDIAGQLRRKLSAARGHVTSAGEAAVLDRADEAVAAYLQGEPRTFERAYEALEDLIRHNVDVARAVEARSGRRADTAMIVGTAIVLALLSAFGLFWWWLRSNVTTPLLELSRAMSRFSDGDRDARASGGGPRELREMEACFNRMADHIARQRQTQIAFLAGVAHDLRTPLSVLRLSLERVRPGRPLPDEAKLRHTFSLVGRQVTRLDRMLGDLLDHAQLDAGRLELRREEHDLRDIATDIYELFKDASRRHELRLSLPDDEVRAPCDRLRLEQVLTNLVSNAIKYSPGGPVELAVHAGVREVVVTVADQGVGIAADEQARLFEPFQRAGQSMTAATGSGLGLYVARRIVEAHGGSIGVESRPGAGSRFEVRLPCEHASEAGTPPTRSAAPPPDEARSP
jgi:two-component system, OmpR family, sensor histidine kinase MtrB